AAIETPPRTFAGEVVVETGHQPAVTNRVTADVPFIHTTPAARTIASVGLSIRECPLTVGRGGSLQEGEVLSLRAGAVDQDNAAIVSAMIAVRYGGHEMLWCTP